jgi:hypothetical protein
MALKSHVEGAPFPGYPPGREPHEVEVLAARRGRFSRRDQDRQHHPEPCPERGRRRCRHRRRQRYGDASLSGSQTMPAIANSQRAPMRCRDAGLGLQVAARVETAACRRSAAPRFDGRSRLPGSARRRVPESVGRRPLSLAAVERPSRTLVPRPSRVRRQTSRTMTTMMTTTTAMGWSTGPPEGRPGNPTLPGVAARFAGASVGSEQFAYRGLVGSYLLEIDREARSADKEQPHAQPSHSPRGRPDTIASTSSRGAIAASSSTRRPGGPRSDRRGVPRRAGERVDGRSAARASSCWPSTGSERNARVCC